MPSFNSEKNNYQAYTKLGTGIVGLTRGVVVSNLDPMFAGRVKVWIPVIHGFIGDDVNIDETGTPTAKNYTDNGISDAWVLHEKNIDLLPWAKVLNTGWAQAGWVGTEKYFNPTDIKIKKKTVTNVQKPYGIYNLPKPGTEVFIMFEQNDPEYPVVVGSFQHKLENRYLPEFPIESFASHEPFKVSTDDLDTQYNRPDKYYNIQANAEEHHVNAADSFLIKSERGAEFIICEVPDKEHMLFRSWMFPRFQNPDPIKKETYEKFSAAYPNFPTTATAGLFKAKPLFTDVPYTGLETTLEKAAEAGSASTAGVALPTKDEAPKAAEGGFKRGWPVENPNVYKSMGPMAQFKGTGRASGPHNGIDLPIRPLTNILAPIDGKIIAIRNPILPASRVNESLVGTTIVLLGDDEMTHEFKHLDAWKVAVGDRVKLGQVIGGSGNDRRGAAQGRSAGLGVDRGHLHWDVFQPGSKANIWKNTLLQGTTLFVDPHEWLLGNTENKITASDATVVRKITAPAGSPGKTTSAQSGTGADKTKLIAAQNAAISNPAFQPRGGVTYCNMATMSVAKAMGAPMEPLKGNANQQSTNLKTSTLYKVVPVGEAQSLADQGYLVIAAWINPTPSGHGHMNTVRPAGVPGDTITGNSGPIVANVGSKNGVGRQSTFFPKSAFPSIVYYTPKSTSTTAPETTPSAAESSAVGGTFIPPATSNNSTSQPVKADSVAMDPKQLAQFLATVVPNKEENGRTVGLEMVLIEGEETIKLRHTSGSYIEIDLDGNINMFSVGDINFRSNRSINLDAWGGFLVNAGAIFLKAKTVLKKISLREIREKLPGYGNLPRFFDRCDRMREADMRAIVPAPALNGGGSGGGSLATSDSSGNPTSTAPSSSAANPNSTNPTTTTPTALDPPVGGIPIPIPVLQKAFGKNSAIETLWPLVVAALKEQGIDTLNTEIAAACIIQTECRWQVIKEKRANPAGNDAQKKVYKAQEKYWYTNYMGRGLIQLTWDYNYKAAGLALGLDFVGKPDLVMQPDNAAKVLAWFFKKNGVNTVANANKWSGEHASVRGLVGGGNGIDVSLPGGKTFGVIEFMGNVNKLTAALKT